MDTKLSSYWRVWVVCVLVSVGLLVLDVGGVFGGVRAVIERGLSPLAAMGSATVDVIHTPRKAILFYRNGTERIVDLESRVAELSVQANQVEALKEENLRLRELASAPVMGEVPKLPIRVFGEDSGMLVVGGGSHAGLESGRSVVSSEGVLVGKVGEVSGLFGEVELLASLDDGVRVVVGPSKTEGVVRWSGEGLVLDQVLSSESVAVGEIVTSSGVDGFVPGLLVGKVLQVEDTTGEVHKRATIEPGVTVDNLDTVFMLGEEEDG